MLIVDGLNKEKKTVNTVKNRLSKTLFGALNLKNSKFYWKQSDKGNSKYFIRFLHQLNKSYKDKKIVIILDNGSIHKSKLVKKFIAKHDWVELHYLPPYSPEYNPIERFWLWLKNKVYGCKSFATTDALIGKLRKLIWHYHEDNLVSKINFNYEPYKELL